MISIVKALYEVLYDPKWTERFKTAQNKYWDASKTPGLDKSSKTKLQSMSMRSYALGRRNDPTNSADKDFNKKFYKEQTDKLYPERAKQRKANAISLLPKALQK